MTDRELVIVHLLENLNAYGDPLQSRGGLGDGVALPLLPLTYSRSVREVERLLHVMRDGWKTRVRFRSFKCGNLKCGCEYVAERIGCPRCRSESAFGGAKVLDATTRQLWWHVMAWYVDADRSPVVPRRVKVPRSRGRKLVRLAVDSSGRALPVRRVVRARGARLDIADAGVKWLAAHWPAGWEPSVPFVHGTPSGRRHGCECAECLAAGKPGKRVAA